MEVSIILLILAMISAVPIAALILAVVAKVGAGRAQKAADRANLRGDLLGSEVAALKKKLALLEAAGATPVEEKQEPAVSATAPEGVEEAESGAVEAAKEAETAVPGEEVASSFEYEEASPAGESEEPEEEKSFVVPGPTIFSTPGYDQPPPPVEEEVEEEAAGRGSPDLPVSESPPAPSVTAGRRPYEPTVRSGSARTGTGIQQPEAKMPPPPIEGRKEPTGGTKSWEKRLGIAFPVWIGAIALALSGAFLVKYSVEHGLIGPTARVAIATFFGLVFLVAGEWLLRKRTPMPAQGASAAGIAVLYAAFLGATVLYHLVNPWVGFSMLLLVTAAGVALSLRQGRVVAYVGLIGGFFTPYFIGIISASPVRLFAYLLLLQGALLVVTRKRRWTGLTTLTLVLGMGAAFQRMFSHSAVHDARWIGLFLLLSAGAFIFAGRSWGEKKFGEEGATGRFTFGNFLGLLTILGALGALLGLAIRTGFATEEWVFLGILDLGIIAMARLDARNHLLAWVAFLCTVLLQEGWVLRSRAAELPRVLLVVSIMGGIFALASYLAHFNDEHPSRWATLSILWSLSAFGLSYQVWKLHGEYDVHWGYLSLLLAILYLFTILRAVKPAARAGVEGEETLAAFCVATTTFVSLALPLELSNEWITVGWALEAAALGWLLTKIRVRTLGVMGVLVGGGVVVRLLLNPSILSYPIGSVPVFNWFLYGYGIPLIAFTVAAVFYRKAEWKRASLAFGWAASAFAFALLTLEVRQGFHTLQITRGSPDLVEWATYSHCWLGAALLLLLLRRKWKADILSDVAFAFTVIALAKILLIDCIEANPMLTGFNVGSWPVVNWLLYAYGLPVFLTALVAVSFRGKWNGVPRNLLAWASGAMGLVFLALEARQWFHPWVLNKGTPGIVEWATYSNLWLLAGLALFLLYRRRGSPFFKRLGLAYAAIAVAKIGLVDLLIFNPIWSGSNVGILPVWNWTLYAYGFPMAMLACFALLGDRSRFDVRTLSAWASAFLLFCLLGMEARQWFHHGNLSKGMTGLVELTTYSHVWFIAALAFLVAYRRRGVILFRNLAWAFGAVAFCKMIFIDLLGANPLWNSYNVGDHPFFNWLLYAYGLPILLFAVFALLSRDEKLGVAFSRVAMVGGYVLALVLLTLEVRQFFHHPLLNRGALLEMENYSYSAVWILFALFLLVVGIVSKGKGTRFASLVVIFLAVSKVFVYDLRQLKDLYRVGSFLALGVSLLLIAFLYQRFVFKDEGNG